MDLVTGLMDHGRSLSRTIPAAAALLASAMATPAHAIDPFFPQFGNNGIDVRHYALKLDVDAGTHRIEGRATLRIAATQKLSDFSLDLSGLQVDRVELDGRAVRFIKQPNKLKTYPASPIAKGRQFELTVVYRGVPESIPDPTSDDPDILGLGWNNYRQTSYVVSEPVGAGSWYPVNDQPNDKAGYSFRITVAKPYVAVANGEPVSVLDQGTKRTFIWEQRQPMASYLAIADIGKFDLDWRRSKRGVDVRNFLTAATPAGDRTALKQTPKMIDFIEGLIAPYPFDSYGAVMVDDPELYYALETQAMTTFPIGFSAGGQGEGFVVHELAHQWFGDAVTVARWRDLWLAEGFATYFEYLWADRGDRQALEADMTDLYDYAADEKVGSAVVSKPEDIFADNTYVRGCLTLHALRLQVGDDKFFRILKTYYRTYRNGNATSQNFIDVAAGIGGQGVRPLLRAWLYEQPLPAWPGARAMAADAARSKVAMPKLVAAARHHRAN